MPAYNEAECIEKVIAGWTQALSKIVGQGQFKMVIVNDGSKDDTGAILDKIASFNSNIMVIHQANAGHGPALMNGYRKACEMDAAYIFQVDSDDQFLPMDFQKLWDNREKSKFIMGWRQVRGDALHRHVIAKILRTLIFLFFGAFVKDGNIPFRLIERNYLKRLLGAMPSGLFAPNIFLAILASRNGQNLMFIPVTHLDRATGVVSMMGWKLFKICLRSVRELVDFRLSLNSRLKQLC